ncbi:MAG: hypothetical protein IKE75_04055 [Bacilli bacterium]|nr:hypothetical protein [Bacilli bacterium]
MTLNIINKDVCKNQNLKLSKNTVETNGTLIGYIGWKSRYISIKRTFQKMKQNK